MKIKKFTKILEEYGPDTNTFSVGDLREELKKSDPQNPVSLKIVDGDKIIEANVKSVYHKRVDKNSYYLIIEGDRIG